MIPTKKQLRKIFRKAVDEFAHKKALTIFEKARAQYWQDEEFLINLGFLYDHTALMYSGTARRQLERHALSVYRAALKINSSSPAALWGIARVYWHRSDRQALRWAKMALHNAKPGCERMLYTNNLGLVYMRLKQFEKADYYFKKSKRMRCFIRGKKESFLFNRVLLYLEWKRDSSALQRVAQDTWTACARLPQNQLKSKTWKMNCRLLKQILQK